MKWWASIGIYTLLMIVGLAFTAQYVGIYQDNTRHVGYLVVSLIGAAEAVFAAVSLVFYVRGRHTKATVIFHTLTAVFCLLVLVLTAFWLFPLLPPSQR